jgi:hypothetical protein
MAVLMAAMAARQTTEIALAKSTTVIVGMNFTKGPLKEAPLIYLIDTIRD